MRGSTVLVGLVAASAAFAAFACSGDDGKRDTIDFADDTGGRGATGGETSEGGEEARGGAETQSGGTAGTGESSGGEPGSGGSAGEEPTTGGTGPDTGGSGGTAGATGGVSAGGVTGTAGAGGAEVISLAPVVTITSPPESTSSQDGNVIIEDEIEVLCIAEQSAAAGSNPVDTVSIRLLFNDIVEDESRGTDTGELDEYAASFPTQNLANGPIAFECEANDTSRPELTGSDRIDTFVDHGPTIVVDEPLPDEPLPLLQPVGFDFTVLPDPLEADDPQAEVQDVQLRLAGVDIPNCADADPPCFAEDPDLPGHFTADIDFADTFYFNPTPESVQVVISATNGRSPLPATRTTQFSFDLDGVGPTLTIQSPAEGAVVRGRVTLQFTLSDDSGIDEDTLQVEVLGFPEVFDYPTDGEWQVNGSTYRFAFDTVTLPLTQSDVELTIRVKDAVGNSLPGGAAVLNLALDNLPPVVDLDPGPVREMTWLTRNETKKCSPPFSPITQDPGNQYAPPPDGALKPGVVEATFRALVWDQTNGAPGDPYVTYSFADRETVFIYARNAADAAIEPLVFDSTGDGLCDEVDDTASVKDLDPVAQSGTPWYTAQTNVLNLTAAPTASCTIPGTEPDEPQNRCSGGSHDMYYVMKHATVPQAVTEPVVYAIPPLAGESCTGDGWPLTQDARIGEGWVCIAGRAYDRVGNRGISAPLRVCFDSPEIAGTPDCSVDAMPTCTDGCVLPPRFVSLLWDHADDQAVVTIE